MSAHLPLQAALRDAVAPFAGRPVIVHSDLYRASGFVPEQRARKAMLESHVALLDALGVELLIPAFNYRYPKTRATDLRSAPVELGPLGEHMRLCWAGARTTDPIFSFLAKGPRPAAPPPDPFVAFGPATAFADVVARDGAVLLYGAGLAALTLIHHAEVASGGPAYRYDKDFPGAVTDWSGVEHRLTFRYHVRPMGLAVDYDWPRIEARLLAAGALRWIDAGRRDLGCVLAARAFVEVLLAELRRDPAWPLDAPSRAWVEPKLQQLGRRFALGDFE